MVEKKEEICKHCGNDINLAKDKYVSLGTNVGVKELSKHFFHFVCWNEWYKQQIQEGVVNSMQGAKKLIKQLAGEQSPF